MEALPEVPTEIKLWKDEFEAGAPNNTGKPECSRSTFGYRATGDEGTIDAHYPEISSTKKIKQHIGVEREDYNVEYEKTHANANIIKRKVLYLTRS